MVYDERREHENVGFAITVTMAILSILGAIGMLITFKKCPEERNTIRQLLLALTLADCLVAFSNLSGSIKLTSEDYVSTQGKHENPYNNTSSGLCVTQSFVSTTSSLVSFFYNISIAVYFYVVAIVTNESRIRSKIIWVHLTCWVVPIIILMAALTKNALGDNINPDAGTTGPWCWISSDLPPHRQIMWMVLTAQGWEVIGYVLGPVFWCLMFYQFHKLRSRDQHHNQDGRFAWINLRMEGDNPVMCIRDDDWNFRFVPFIFYLLRMWGSIRFIIATIQLQHTTPFYIPNEAKTFLYIMQCIGDNSQGFCNFVLFCLIDKQIRRRMRELYCKRNVEMERAPLTRNGPDNIHPYTA